MIALALALAVVVQQADDSTRATLHARRAAAPPVIDGVVDSTEWSGADSATAFRQFLPQRGAPASRPTIARVLHDNAALYVAFEVHDDQAPTAQEPEHRAFPRVQHEGVSAGQCRV